jgi:peptidoglycan hydrolase CwlO-like protein
MRRLFLVLSAVLLLSPLTLQIWAQTQKDPLNEDEIDQVREFGDRPNDRVKLLTKFIEQRITAIKQLSTDKRVENRSAELRAKIEEFTRLVDELQDNLDTYDSQHADVRKALKELVPESDKWEPVLHQPPSDPNYEFARKTAVEAAQSIADQTKTLQKDQEKYFTEHKDQAGKNGTGPS